MAGQLAAAERVGKPFVVEQAGQPADSVRKLAETARRLNGPRVAAAWFASLHAVREPFAPNYPYPGNRGDDEQLMTWVSATLSALGDKHNTGITSP